MYILETLFLVLFFYLIPTPDPWRIFILSSMPVETHDFLRCCCGFCSSLAHTSVQRWYFFYLFQMRIFLFDIYIISTYGRNIVVLCVYNTYSYLNKCVRKSEFFGIAVFFYYRCRAICLHCVISINKSAAVIHRTYKIVYDLIPNHLAFSYKAYSPFLIEIHLFVASTQRSNKNSRLKLWNF